MSIFSLIPTRAQIIAGIVAIAGFALWIFTGQVRKAERQRLEAETAKERLTRIKEGRNVATKERETTRSLSNADLIERMRNRRR